MDRVLRRLRELRAEWQEYAPRSTRIPGAPDPENQLDLVQITSVIVAVSSVPVMALLWIMAGPRLGAWAAAASVAVIIGAFLAERGHRRISAVILVIVLNAAIPFIGGVLGPGMADALFPVLLCVPFVLLPFLRLRVVLLATAATMGIILLTAAPIWPTHWVTLSEGERYWLRLGIILSAGLFAVTTFALFFVNRVLVEKRCAGPCSRPRRPAWPRASFWPT